MSEVTELNKQLESSRELVELKNAVLRLSDNKDFRELVILGFCRDEAAANVKLSGNMHMEKDNRDNALAIAQAAGHFERYMSQMMVEGMNAERIIPQIEKQLQELLIGGQDD